MNRVFLICIALVYLSSRAVSAQQPTFQSALLDRLTGSWVLRGVVAGSKTIHDIQAEWVLNHQYVRFQETSREKNAQGQPLYAADVYFGWNEAKHEYACIWLDINGGITTQIIGHGKPGAPNDLVLLFDEGDSSFFHTVFSYDEADRTWQMRMDEEKDGKLNPFARAKLSRP
jgi:hypothetical protein